MFLQLNHQKLEVFKASHEFVLECYKFSNTLPNEERFSLAQQIIRAALSVTLNIAEGSSRKSEKERYRFFEISRGSIIEIDAALDLCENLKYCEKSKLDNLGKLMIKIFSMLSRMIKSNTDELK